MFKWYLGTAKKVLIQPILFYTKLPAGDWADKPITFTVMGSWILALAISLMVFINKLAPIGATLLVQVKGLKLLMVSPVTLVLAFMFFVIVFSIVGGLLMALFLLAFYGLGALLYLPSRWLGGSGQYFETVKAGLYSSAILLVGLLVIILACMVKFGILDFTNYSIGYNIVYSFCVLYLYGLLAIAARKTQNLSRTKSFIAALLPAALLILVGIAVNKAIVPKMADWIQ